MFKTIETLEGATAIINLAHITHVTMSDPAYAEEGSVIHFVSDRVVQVKHEIADLERMLADAARELAGGTRSKDSFLLP